MRIDLNFLYFVNAFFLKYVYVCANYNNVKILVLFLHKFL